MSKKIIVALITCIAVFSFGTMVLSATDKKKPVDDIFKEVELFSDTLAIIQTDYVDEVKPKDLIYGALKGMLSSLDPHSQFMDPETYSELKIDTEGKFGGIGIEITVKDGLLTVITPIEDTPAWKAGLKANDRIVKINNEITRELSLSEAVKKLRGKAGDSVNITVLRESEKKILDFKIVRDIIKIRDIKDAKILEDGIGYIRIVEFRENTPQALQNALDSLSKQGMNALVIDLRNNPGGLLESAVNVTDKFIESGKKIVYTKGRKASQNMEFISHNAHPLTNLPLAILINEGSASGSEIVAGCLQDYKRAVIIGVKSFGKGSVQTVVPLSDGSALRLTTSKYFTPSGKVIHGNGVIPDIMVEEGKIELSQDKDLLPKKTDEIFDAIENKDKPKDTTGIANYKTDNQLMRAVDILKAFKAIKLSKINP